MLIKKRNRSRFYVPRSAFRVPRFGFTLVELLVAVALTVAIMGIIGYAMGRSIDTFRNLNAVANMQTKLVSAQMVMKRDLSAEHFGGNFNSFSGPYVGDQRLDLIGWRPPEEGFFAIYQGNASVIEGVDNDGVPSFRSVCHSLHFTAKLSGKREEDYFYAAVPAGNALAMQTTPADFRRPTNNVFASQWAEVFYFLVPTGQNANGQALFTLYRRQRLVIPASSTAVVWSPVLDAQFPHVSSPLNGNLVNTSSAVALPPWMAGGSPWPENRLNIVAYSPAPDTGTIWGTRRIQDIPGVNPTLVGDDILMTDVISFEIKANWSTGNASTLPNESLPPLNVANPATFDWPFSILPFSPRNPNMSLPSRRFDTWSQQASPNFNWDDPNAWAPANANGAQVPLRIRVQSLQIRIRIWDFNTNQARQVCFVQDI